LIKINIFFIFIVVLGVGMLWHLQKFLKYIKYIILEFILLYSSTFVPGIVSTFHLFNVETWNKWNGKPCHFFHLHTCAHSICTIFTLPYHFLTSSPLPLAPTPRQDLFCPLVLWFVNEKNSHFCLFKIATQGVSLCHFHVYMYYSSSWFISSIFHLSTLVPFLWWFQQI
jgi:hypothetical protein